MSSVPGFLPGLILVTGICRDTEAIETDRWDLWSHLCPHVDGPQLVGWSVSHHTSTLPLGTGYEDKLQ